MPYDHPASRLAVVDIGSNSVRMVIYDISHNPPIQVFNEKVFCALGRDLGRTGMLSPEGKREALKALKAYTLITDIQKIPHGQLIAVGTAALRDAGDGREFINEVYKQTGLKIRIISGDEEARYAAHGVMMFAPDADGVAADFGGGSLEFARVSKHQILDTTSLPLGAYRVEAHGEKADEIIAQACHDVFDRFGNCTALYAIGGSWRALAGAYMIGIGEQHPLQGYRVNSQAMADFCAKIAFMDVELIRQMFRMEGHRAALAPVAAKTLASVLNTLKPQYFVVSLAGVRDGLVHEYLSLKGKKV
ncbi:MAG: hypothetical protein WC043_08520 [Pseudobdellovibrionaceae bacterium]